MNNFFIDELELEDLTFSVYGRAISMTGIARGQTYAYQVKAVPLGTDETVREALQDGYTSHENYAFILQDICSKGLICEGLYSVVVWPLNAQLF